MSVGLCVCLPLSLSLSPIFLSLSHFLSFSLIVSFIFYQPLPISFDIQLAIHDLFFLCLLVCFIFHSSFSFYHRPYPLFLSSSSFFINRRLHMDEVWKIRKKGRAGWGALAWYLFPFNQIPLQRVSDRTFYDLWRIVSVVKIKDSAKPIISY